MNHRQTETSKEVRLWIKDVILPVGTTIGLIFGMFPESREYVKDKGRKAKEKIKDFVKKW